LPEGLESSDPIDGNPFATGDPRHSVWRDATIRAEQELHQVNAAYLNLARDSPEPVSPGEARRLVLDRYAYLVSAKFDIWAKRGIQIIRSDVEVKAFDRWLANYANSWLNSMKSHLPPGNEAGWLLGELRLALIGRVEFWKSEARRYLADQKAYANSEVAAALPVTADLFKDKPAGSDSVAGENIAIGPSALVRSSEESATPTDHGAMTEAYREEVYAKTGKRPTYKSIAKAAGYSDTTELRRWRNQGSKRQANKAANEAFMRVLTMEKPHLK
jgi:hypothetical protein